MYGGMGQNSVKTKSKIGLGHCGCPAVGQSPHYFTWVISDPSVLLLLLLGVRVSVSQAGGVLHHLPKELHQGPPVHRSVLFMVVDSLQANLLFELRMRAVCGETYPFSAGYCSLLKQTPAFKHSPPRLPRALSGDSETDASCEGGDCQPSVGGNKLVSFLLFLSLYVGQNSVKTKSKIGLGHWWLPRCRSKPTLLHLGHLRPFCSPPPSSRGPGLCLPSWRCAPPSAQGTTPGPPSPPERAVHGCRFAASQSAV